MTVQFHFNRWLVYFYFYCIVGWIFESVYVSVRFKKITNRGFMKGPWLPIYGSGAVIILLSTLPFADKPLAVYMVGAVAATALEYVTGVMMVKLFKVRYWDYSYRKIQFQGHICLHSTIGWGFMSLIAVYVVHEPVVRFINRWNENVLNIVTFLITVCMAYDFANAFRNAMDLRELIIQAEQLRQRMSEVVEDRKDHLAAAMGEKKEHLTTAVEEKKEQLVSAVEEKKEHLTNAVEERKEYLASAVEEKWDNTLAELEVAREKIRKSMEKCSSQLLLHNPGSGFFGLKEESKEIKKRLMERRRK